MPEKTLPLPLSGTEIKTAILDLIEQKLSKDCYLHPASAYGYFGGKITIELALNDLGRVDEVKTEVKFGQGEIQPGMNLETTTAEVDVEKEFRDPEDDPREPVAPNKVRVKSGQPVPTATGKRIKYQRDAAKSVAAEEKAG